jgi:hypothetical protein
MLKEANMAAIIGTYNYTYGAGNEHNRQIQFSRVGPGANTIQAQVYVLNPGNVVGALTSVVPGANIEIEMENTAQKAGRMMLARAQNLPFNDLPNEVLSNLTILPQDAIMYNLASRRISIANNHPLFAGANEVVASLTISALN